MKLTIKYEQGRTEEFKIPKKTVTIGRSNKCDIVITDEALSRQHCVIDLENGSFFITDPGSANGVYIDGQRITPLTKTSFGSFNQISIGPIDCLVEDNEIELETNPSFKLQTPSPKVERSEATSVTRMMTSPPHRRSAAAKEEKKKINAGMMIPVVLFLVVGYYFFSSKSEDTEMEIGVEQIQPRPNPRRALIANKNIPNEFLLPSEYDQHNTTKSCTEHAEFCQHMELETAHHEGIQRHADDYVVYVNPSKRLALLRYLPMKEMGDIQDLISFDIMLASNLMNKFFLREVNQIHMVINDVNGKPLKVYRFHPARFVPGEAPRIELISALNTAFQNKDSQGFWKLLGDAVPTIPLVVN